MEITEILQGTQNVQFVVTRNDLIEFAETYAKTILAGQPISQPPEAEQPISQPAAIEFLGKSRQTLIKWRKKGIITGHTLGGRVYYLKSELLEALKTA